jgi:DNA-binding MarR family transcriptional regulator
MGASGTGVRLEELAHRLVEAFTRFCVTLPAARRRPGELKEVEFLTLALLRQHRTMIVGDIQRLLGVLPAQMSRIIRSLADRERPLIGCRINPQDKRKVDVVLTPAGERALQDYQSPRVQALAGLFAVLTDEDLDDLSRLLDKLHGPTPSPALTG